MARMPERMKKIGATFVNVLAATAAALFSQSGMFRDFARTDASSPFLSAHGPVPHSASAWIWIWVLMEVVAVVVSVTQWFPSHRTDAKIASLAATGNIILLLSPGLFYVLAILLRNVSW